MFRGGVRLQSLIVQRAMHLLPCTSLELNLDVVLLNGQSFRWRRIREAEAVYSGVARDRVWYLRRIDDSTIGYDVVARFDAGDSQAASQQDDEAALRDYLQLNVNLEQLYAAWSSADEHFVEQLKKQPQTLRGLRMLRQDVLETTFAFICSANNNIARITKMVNRLCSLYGEQLEVEVENERQTFYNFPTLEQLYAHESNMETTLRAEGFGYRAAYIASTTRKLHALGGRKWLEDLIKVDYEEAHESLLSELAGVGPKVGDRKIAIKSASILQVADCICLMALDKSNAIPVDTHVFRITSTHYMPELRKKKSANKKEMAEINKFYLERFGKFAGWAHSVLFTTQLKFLNQNAPEKTSAKKRKKR